MFRTFISLILIAGASTAMAADMYAQPQLADNAPHAVPVYTSATTAYPSPHVAPMPTPLQPAPQMQESAPEPHLQRMNF